MTRALVLALLVPLLLAQVARGDDAKPRYVAQQGEDQGDCSLPVRPCRTIQYAVSVAGKGDQVRVAQGTYQLTEVLDAVLLVAGTVDVQGGFDRFDHFLRQAPVSNRTTLTGVPVAFRDPLQARGFQVVVDRKGMDATDRAALAGFRATLTSSTSADCVDHEAGRFSCDNVDLLAHVALADLSSLPDAASDVWGFVDLNTEREYALLGVWNGLAVIDVTDTAAPFEVGTVLGSASGWRDVKVSQTYVPDEHRWRTYAYVSTEVGGRLAVVDLTGLPNRVRLGRRSDTSAHNVYVSNVDYTTGVPFGEDGTPPLLQVLGSADNLGAFRSFDLGDPLNLVEVATSTGGYSHDATSMLIADDRVSACKASTERCEVLLDFNETEIKLWDFSDQRAPELLSSTTYADVGYVHSGWWTEDGRYLFVHDELDEYESDLETTVRVFDLGDLTAPQLVTTWTGSTAAIDHNGYVRGSRYFMSNYTRGLTILDIAEPTEPVEVGFFDTHPPSDRSAFTGAWGVYPFLPGGKVLVSDFSGGLFILGERTRSSEHVQVGFRARAFGGEEGDEVSVSVVRTGSGGAVAADYAVLVGSAGSADIVTSTGTLEWPSQSTEGDTIRNISVPLLRDDVDEPIERAFVRLSNPTGGAVLADLNMAYLFVGDPGRTTSIGFAQKRIAVDETAGRLIATVERSGSPLGEASVAYEVGSISASPGADYVAVEPGELSWPDGDATARTIVVPLIEDGEEELAEQFEIHLSSPAGAALAGDRLVVDINADGMATTGFMLFDDGIRQDLEPITHDMKLGPDTVPPNSGIRVKVRNPDDVESVALTVDGIDETHTANEEPYVFHVLGRSPQGTYTLRATPYSEDDLGGKSGQPLGVTFAVSGPPRSSDASLRNLELSGIYFDFRSDIEIYNLTVGPHLGWTTVSPTPATGATYQISPSDSDLRRSGHQVRLAPGLNRIDIAVTSENDEATRNYTVRIIRMRFVIGP